MQRAKTTSFRRRRFARTANEGTGLEGTNLDSTKTSKVETKPDTEVDTAKDAASSRAASAHTAKKRTKRDLPPLPLEYTPIGSSAVVQPHKLSKAGQELVRHQLALDDPKYRLPEDEFLLSDRGKELLPLFTRAILAEAFPEVPVEMTAEEIAFVLPHDEEGWQFGDETSESHSKKIQMGEAKINSSRAVLRDELSSSISRDGGDSTLITKGSRTITRSGLIVRPGVQRKTLTVEEIFADERALTEVLDLNRYNCIKTLAWGMFQGVCKGDTDQKRAWFMNFYRDIDTILRDFALIKPDSALAEEIDLGKGTDQVLDEVAKKFESFCDEMEGVIKFPDEAEDYDIDLSTVGDRSDPKQYSKSAFMATALIATMHKAGLMQSPSVADRFNFIYGPEGSTEESQAKLEEIVSSFSVEKISGREEIDEYEVTTKPGHYRAGKTHLDVEDPLSLVRAMLYLMKGKFVNRQEFVNSLKENPKVIRNEQWRIVAQGVLRILGYAPLDYDELREDDPYKFNDEGDLETREVLVEEMNNEALVDIVAKTREYKPTGRVDMTGISSKDETLLTLKGLRNFAKEIYVLLDEQGLLEEAKTAGESANGEGEGYFEDYGVSIKTASDIDTIPAQELLNFIGSLDWFLPGDDISDTQMGDALPKLVNIFESYQFFRAGEDKVYASNQLATAPESEVYTPNQLAIADKELEAIVAREAGLIIQSPKDGIYRLGRNSVFIFADQENALRAMARSARVFKEGLASFYLDQDVKVDLDTGRRSKPRKSA